MRRLSIIQLRQQLDIWEIENSLTPIQWSIYFALVRVWDRLNGKEEFSLSNTELARRSGYDVKNVKKVTNSLVQKGLITLRKGSNGTASPKYSICPPTPRFTAGVTSESTSSITPESMTFEEREIERKEEKAAAGDFQKITDLYQENFGQMPPILYEDIRLDLKAYGFEVMREALKQAALKGGRSYSLVRKILKDYEAAGVKTFEQAKMENHKFERPKSVVQKTSRRYI